MTTAVRVSDELVREARIFSKIDQRSFTGQIEYQDEKIIYQTGDGVFIPDGKEHKHRAKVLSEFVKVIFVETV